MTQRFLIVAWPEDHEEDLEQHACDLQDAIDMIQMGGARVFNLLSEEHTRAVEGLFARGVLP